MIERTTPSVPSTSGDAASPLRPPPLSSASAGPFLKWAGGKSRLLAAYADHFPERFGAYHEPFLGGGAVFFHLRPGQAVLSDANPRLIELWTVVRDEPEALWAQVRVHRGAHGRAYYYRCRDRFNAAQGLSRVERAGLFLYLNKTCFNGLYRENKRGEFNVPFGDYADPRIVTEEQLWAASRALRGVELRNEDFVGVVDRARPGDLVYFDPPYVPLSATSSFTSYHHKGFDLTLQAELAGLFHRLAERGVHVMLSNSDVPLVRELYQGWTLVEIRAPRSISRVGDQRHAVGELLVLSTPAPRSVPVRGGHATSAARAAEDAAP